MERNWFVFDWWCICDFDFVVLLLVVLVVVVGLGFVDGVVMLFVVEDVCMSVLWWWFGGKVDICMFGEGVNIVIGGIVW